MSRGFFVTGTDTGVGKTYVAQVLLHQLARAGYKVAGMKPVASGCRATPHGLRNSDAMALRVASNLELDYADVNPYAFEEPVAPHLAAGNSEIHLGRIQECLARVRARADWVVVEGAGGWRVPLNPRAAISDLARLLALPVILVVGMRLGCINHALLSAEAITRDGAPLAGWVANEMTPNMRRVADNIATLRDRMSVPLLGVIPYRESGLDAATENALALALAISDFGSAKRK